MKTGNNPRISLCIQFHLYFEVAQSVGKFFLGGDITDVVSLKIFGITDIVAHI